MSYFSEKNRNKSCLLALFFIYTIGKNFKSFLKQIGMSAGVCKK